MSQLLSETLTPIEIRELYAKDKNLGCGNFIHVAARTSPTANKPLIWLDHDCRSLSGDVVSNLSVLQIKQMADEYAAWYYGAGIREKDPVAVYLSEGIENLIHYVALTGIGAIPILINGNMKPEIAAIFIAKTGAVALFSDTAHSEKVTRHLSPTLSLRFNEIQKTALSLGAGSLPKYYPYQHTEKDVVLVGHSSGTTGIPKAVIFQHEPNFYGIRYRLSLPHAPGSERVLSALPHSHSAGIAYIMLAILAGSAVQLMSDNDASIILPYIEHFKPTMVVAFPETYVKLTEGNFDAFDLSSVRIWMNGGDAAHEAHIRKLISVGTFTRDGKTIKGSLFIDGLGSSEMGFSLFRMIHTPDSKSFNRCIGTPIEWVDAVVLGENGEKLPPYQVGKLGVKSPTITAGYWNDSLLTARSQVRGYWLTGDLFYYDEQGKFFHVDRIPDAIRTSEGPVYSLQTEELLLKHCCLLSDLTVVGVSADGNYQSPIALARLKKGTLVSEEQLLSTLNAILQQEGLRPLAASLLVDWDNIPLGPTGKVLKKELREEFSQFLIAKNRSQYANRVVR